MAKPRVLVSSTCYDLYLIREQLKNLIDEMGYESVLSEDGDMFYSPNLHVHLSCISEVRHCDMVVLVVGNKFGSEYILKTEKSITQEEHNAAYISTIPIFTFIDQKVLHDFSIYRKIIDQAKAKGLGKEHIDQKLSEIPFGSEPDLRVFTFIEDICNRSRNNAYFPFQNFGDIRDALKKQWAGMVFDFLSQRRNDSSNKQIANLLSNLEIASSKIEQVVELMAKNTLSGEAQDHLKLIEDSTENKRLYSLLYEIWDSFHIDTDEIQADFSVTDEKIEKIYDLLLSTKENSEDNYHIRFQKYLQEIGLLGKDNWYIHFRVKYRIAEFVETCERNEIEKVNIIKAIKNTLMENINKKTNI